MKWLWFVGVAAYVVPAIIMLVYILHNGLEKPVVGSLFWPLRIIKMLFGGG